jgi:hypothetical protein
VREVPAAVRALLAASRTLQDKLRLWALEKASETDVSDCYVAIGNEFNGTINAFAAHDIDLRCALALLSLPLPHIADAGMHSEVYGVPKELREILESCLGEDPSPQVLNTYMPQVRRVLYTLLQGLQAKQPVWQRAVAANGRGTPPSYMT